MERRQKWIVLFILCFIFSSCSLPLTQGGVETSEKLNSVVSAINENNTDMSSGNSEKSQEIDSQKNQNAKFEYIISVPSAGVVQIETIQLVSDVFFADDQTLLICETFDEKHRFSLFGLQEQSVFATYEARTYSYDVYQSRIYLDTPEGSTVLSLADLSVQKIPDAKVNINGRSSPDGVWDVSKAERFVCKNIQTGEMQEYGDTSEFTADRFVGWIGENTFIYDHYNMFEGRGIGIVSLANNFHQLWEAEGMVTGVGENRAIFSGLLYGELNIESQPEHILVLSTPNWKIKETKIANKGTFTLSKSGNYLANLQADSSNQEIAITVYDAETEQIVTQKLFTLNNFYNRFVEHDIALSGDGNKLAAVCDSSKSICVFFMT